MFFTREDILAIQHGLSKYAVKDSLFPHAKTPISNNDIITMVLEGRNVKIRIIDFLEQLHLISLDDFLNVSVKFDETSLSITQAARLVPIRSRKIGLVITFENELGKWEIWQYNSHNLTQWNNPEAWENVKVPINSIAVPDEEDLTLVEKNDRSIVKFKDKEYSPIDYSGLGRKYLRKNVVSVKDPITELMVTKNLLSLRMLNKENTIYIIQYDYDLNGETITVPNNCVLKFEGGSIDNGIVKGVNTSIVNIDNSAVFGTGITIDGDWNISEIHDKWFQYNSSPKAINNLVINNVFNLSSDTIHNTIYFDSGRTYWVDYPYKGRADLGTTVRPTYGKLYGDEYSFARIFDNITSNTHLIIDSEIKLLPTNQGFYVMFRLHEKDNIIIEGSGLICGDVHEHLYTSPFVANGTYYGEFGFVFLIEGCTNIIFRDITISDGFGDNILIHPSINKTADNVQDFEIGKISLDITIDNVKIKYARRNGIAVSGYNISVVNCCFEGCGIEKILGTAPKCAIDFENDYIKSDSRVVNRDVVMSNCKFHNNEYDVSSTMNTTEDAGTYGTVISDCNFTAPIRINTTFWLKFINCHIPYISNVKGTTNYFTASKHLCYERCQFDELMPYLRWISYAEENEFINCTSPEDDNGIIKNRIYIGNRRYYKVSIPKNAHGEIKLIAALHTNSDIIVEAVYNLSGLNKLPISTNVIYRDDTTPDTRILKYLPIFSEIVSNTLDDTNEIYLCYGADITDTPSTLTHLVHLWYEARGITDALTTIEVDGKDYYPIFGGNYSKILDVKFELILGEVPSDIPFVTNAMLNASKVQDLPVLPARLSGRTIFALDSKVPVFWSSHDKRFVMSDGNPPHLTRGGYSNMEDLLNELGEEDCGFFYKNITNGQSYIWNGVAWCNIDNTLVEKVTII